MKVSKTKIYVALGVLTGVLIGYGFGAAYGTPGRGLATTGRGEGNISRLTRQRMEMMKDNSDKESQSSKDTLYFEAVDEAGQFWKIEVTHK